MLPFGKTGSTPEGSGFGVPLVGSLESIGGNMCLYPWDAEGQVVTRSRFLYSITNAVTMKTLFDLDLSQDIHGVPVNALAYQDAVRQAGLLEMIPY